MSTVISVENLSKYYRLGLIGGGTLREDLDRWWAKVRGRPDPLLRIGETDHGNRKDGQIWGLRDINLEVQEGEIRSIIGRNGAGKSTLLKILSRIVAPPPATSRFGPRQQSAGGRHWLSPRANRVHKHLPECRNLRHLKILA